ncbi:MAG TPA: S41 family peptidase [Bacteroidia bacterium]|nr:S41 family peptidase [Bacteroidia bacterium]
MQSLRNILNKFKKPIIVVVIAFSSIGFFAFEESNLFEISKNIDIFITLFRELNANYVDDVKAEKIIHKGIDAMLESLDPYTEFIAESDVDEYKLSHVSNEYAGIGALVQQQDGKVIIAEPYYGMPAQKVDLRAGDIVLKIDDKDIYTKKVDDVTALLKGAKNTTVKITVQRKGEASLITKTLTRQEIKIKNVSYFGTIAEGVGYIRLDKFLDNCSAEVKQALISLKEKQHIKAVVLDLRGNGGGILQEAVKIVNLFVPKGTLIVSQKGKVKTNNAEYYATSSPVDDQIPLAILVDNGSASASEIVAGAIQDTDRGIIIGERTFGKGLVQQTLNLSYNSLMKVTIAKYYTPSGRCIQSLDYSHRKDDGSVVKVADSLITEFKTKNKRSIYDGSGIFPDIKTVSPTFHLVSFQLMQKYLIFNYATEFRAKNNEIPSAKTFTLSDQQYNEFVSYVEQAKFDFTTKSEEQLEELEKVSKKEKYYANVSADYEKLKAKIIAKKKTDLINFKFEIKQLIESEIACRYYYQDGRVEASFKYDDDIKEALKVLQTPAEYLAIVNGEGKYKIIGKPEKDTSTPIAQKEEDVDSNDE